MKKSIQMTAVAMCSLMGTSFVQAAVTIDWVSVGNAGNVVDNSTGFGAVGYNYRLARTETNLNDYAEFLNAVATTTDTHGLYNTSMGSVASIAGITRTVVGGGFSYAVTGSGLRPVTYVSWNDAARFVNWMSNGQGAGDTETGTYDMSLATPTAAPGASIYLPTEDEWYKAAYYDPSIGAGDDGDNYWLYPTQSNVAPGNDVGGGSNLANFFDGGFTLGGPNLLTDGGAFTGSGSFYGTFDQGGNVREWNDAVISGSSRGLRGGSWFDNDSFLRSLLRDGNAPSLESNLVGFRLASVPEPTSGVLVMLGCVGMLARRRR